MKFAVAAIIGSASSLQMTRTNQEKLYAMNDESFVQTDKILEKLDNFTGFEHTQDGHPGTQNEFGDFIQPYDRVIPERFEDPAADSYPVDKFTQNMLKNYAVEGIADKDEDPKPNGSFYLSKDSARKSSLEVLCTHFAQCGGDGENYLKLHYEDAWNYYDVNRAGRIDAVGVSQFFRYLTRPLGAIDLQ